MRFLCRPEMVVITLVRDQFPTPVNRPVPVRLD